jgi:hypothetical protein
MRAIQFESREARRIYQLRVIVREDCELGAHWAHWYRSEREQVDTELGELREQLVGFLRWIIGGGIEVVSLSDFKSHRRFSYAVCATTREIV